MKFLKGIAAVLLVNAVIVGSGEITITASESGNGDNKAVVEETKDMEVGTVLENIVQVENKKVPLTIEGIENFTDETVKETGMSLKDFKKYLEAFYYDENGKLCVEDNLVFADKILRATTKAAEEFVYMDGYLLIKADGSMYLNRNGSKYEKIADYKGNGIYRLKSYTSDITIIDNNREIWVYNFSNRYMSDKDGRFEGWIKLGGPYAGKRFEDACTTGSNFMAITEDGYIYGAGINVFGQMGIEVSEDNNIRFGCMSSSEELLSKAYSAKGVEIASPFIEHNKSKYRILGDRSTFYVYAENGNELYAIGNNLDHQISNDNTQYYSKFTKIDLDQFKSYKSNKIEVSNRKINDMTGKYTNGVWGVKIDGEWYALGNVSALSKIIGEGNNISEYYYNKYKININDIAFETCSNDVKREARLSEVLYDNGEIKYTHIRTAHSDIIAVDNNKVYVSYWNGQVKEACIEVGSGIKLCDSFDNIRIERQKLNYYDYIDKIYNVLKYIEKNKLVDKEECSGLKTSESMKGLLTNILGEYGVWYSDAKKGSKYTYDYEKWISRIKGNVLYKTKDVIVVHGYSLANNGYVGYGDGFGRITKGKSKVEGYSFDNCNYEYRMQHAGKYNIKEYDISILDSELGE